MNNDDDNKSSRVNTTPFNNHYENAINRINRERKQFVDKKEFTKNNNYDGLSNDERKQKASEHVNASLNENSNNNEFSKGNSKSINNQNNKLQNKFGRGNIANNLRNKFNTMPSNLDDAKKMAVEKGAEALKKAPDPLMKAAGYGLSAYQKHKNKKEEKEKETEESNEENENQDESNENSQTTEERRVGQFLKKLLPIIGICAGVLMTFLVLFSVLSPVITAYSWFTSLFHHKNEDASSYTIYNEKDSENYKAEQAYNNAILGSKDGNTKGIIAEYQEKYGVTIDWYLLNALITYKYTNDNGDIYSNDNTEELDEEELNKRLEELQNNSEGENNDSTSSDNSGVDFSAASKKIKSFASLMVIKEDGSYTTDTEKNGKVYNNILNSNTYKKYYKSMFKDQTEESYKQILDEIYDYAESARELLKIDAPTNAGVISDTSIIHMQTCAVPYAKTTINGISVYNNPLTNKDTDYPDYLNLSDYIKGTLMTEVGSYMKSEYKEGLKALGVVAVSFMLHDTSSGFNLKSGEMYFPTGNCRQVTCDPTNGCSYLKGHTSGTFGTAFVGLNRFGSNSGQHKPLTTEQNALLDEVVKDIFGKVIVKKGVTSSNFGGSKDVLSLHHYASLSISGCVRGHCLGQTEEMSDAKNGMDYMSILKKYFTAEEFDVIDITEGLYYTSPGEDIKGDLSGLNENYHYHQGDSEWGGLTLCGSGKISGNGCNITSAAIAISILKNQRITPGVLQSRQNSISSCGPGSRPQMIMNFAKLYGLSAVGINKSDTEAVNDMLKKVATGNYVAIIRLAPNLNKSDRYYTKNGHYMAGVAVKTENGKNKLLIWDPAGRSGRDNYWADLEDGLVKNLVATNSFILIGK